MVYIYFILLKKVVTIKKKVQKIEFLSFEKMITNDNKKMQKNALCKMYLKYNYILENIKLWSKNQFFKIC